MTAMGPGERSTSAPDPPVSTVTHGFLVADRRGYTRYVDAHGDHAAADLLDRYRTLVRGAVASFRGAEIKTEGDS
jgi:class 3 adenylate cyclase